MAWVKCEFTDSYRGWGIFLMRPWARFDSSFSSLPPAPTTEGFSGGSLLKKKKKKNPPASAGNARDMGLIPGSGRSLGEGNNNPLQYLAWKSHGHRSLVGLQSMGSQRVGNDYSYTAISLTWVFLRFSFMGTRDQNKSKGERTHQSLHVTWRPWP